MIITNTVKIIKGKKGRKEATSYLPEDWVKRTRTICDLCLNNCNCNHKCHIPTAYNKIVNLSSFYKSELLTKSKERVWRCDRCDEKDGPTHIESAHPLHTLSIPTNFSIDHEPDSSTKEVHPNRWYRIFRICCRAALCIPTWCGAAFPQRHHRARVPIYPLRESFPKERESILISFRVVSVSTLDESFRSSPPLA